MGDMYTNPPQSRNEAILRATIDGTEYTDPPQSRIEDLLIQLKEVIEHGEAKIKIGDVQGATASTSLRTVTLTWSDPSDLELDGVILAKWAGTKVVRKAGSAPADNTDGTVVIDNTTRDAYSETGLVDSDLEYGTTYYYRFFPYTDDGLVTDGSSVSATPEKITIASVPTQSGSLTYNGTEQTAAFSGYDTDQMTATGITGTNAGTYTASFTPKSDYMWWDGTETAKTASWTIAKATNTITASPSSISLDTTTLYQDVTLTQTGDGVLSVVSGDTDVATVGAIENGVFRATGVDNGSTTITVSSTATENYEAGTLEIACSVVFIEIVSFSTGTDAQIKAMLDAYYADQITWQEMGWAIGDTRTIHINDMQAPSPNESNTWLAQDIVVVIVAHDYTTLATPINGHTKSCISVQTRELISGTSAGSAAYIYVNGVSDNQMTFKKWSELYMRTYLNDIVFGAFPSGDFKSSIKASSNYRHTTYNGTEAELVTDMLFLPSYAEIIGTASFEEYTPTSPTEGTQLPYFETSSNRKKYRNNNGTAGSSSGWWTSSTSNNYSSGGYKWIFKTDGLPDFVSANGRNSNSLAPMWSM